MTFMVTAARAANLRAMLADDRELRGTVGEMMALLESTEQEDARGYRRASLLDPSGSSFVADKKARPTELEDETYQLLCVLIARELHPPLRLPRQALLFDDISISGVSYSASDATKFRDSHIIFHHPTRRELDPGGQIAGVVNAIFQYTYNAQGGEHVTDYYLLVREYLRVDATDGVHDIYKVFGFAGGFLCRCDPTQVHVIRRTDVVSHFALTPVWRQNKRFNHVLPVDRVSDPDQPVILA